MRKIMILPEAQRNILVSALEMYKATLCAMPDDWRHDEATQTIQDCRTLCRLLDNEVIITTSEEVQFKYGQTPALDDIFGTLSSMLAPLTIKQ
jgi:hypothetical protein